LNNETSTLTNCTFSGDTALGSAELNGSVETFGSGKGGAIYNNAILTLSYCTLSGNTAQGGYFSANTSPTRITASRDVLK
jgi:hypothetical protein